VELPAELRFELDLIRLRLDVLVERRLVGLAPMEQAEYEKLVAREDQILREAAGTRV
jgi:hypothetical protein